MTGSLAAAHGMAHALLLVRNHSRWMGINLALALVPLILAVVLFRGRRARGPLWWMGAVTFLVFLPNAPYVLTDVVHLGADVRAAGSQRAALLGVLPLYGLFFLAGMESYTLSLRLLRQHLARAGWHHREMAITAAVHLACAVGVVVGRDQRLNSWDVLHPSRLAAGLAGAFGHPIFIVVTVVTVVIGTLTLDRITAACGRLVLRRA